MRRVQLLALVLAASVAGGCNMLAYPLYLISPGESKATKKAEFAGLAGKTVAIMVYADMETQFEYPSAKLELTMLVGQEILKQVKDAKVIDPHRTVVYQEEDIHWDAKPRPELAKLFKADYVLYIALSEFTTHEAGSMNLARGRINAQASLWAAQPPPGGETGVWRKSSISILWPKDQPAGILTGNDDSVRMMIEKLFAEELVRYFYDHKEAKDAK